MKASWVFCRIWWPAYQEMEHWCPYIAAWPPPIISAVMEAIQLRSMETVLEEITLQDHALLMEFMKARDAAGAKQAMAIHLHRAINHLHLQAEMELPPFSAC